MLRRMCALLLALALCCATQALADARPSRPVDANHPAVGVWQLVEYVYEGRAYSAQDIEYMAETITLRADGTAGHALYGESEEGTWADAEGIITLDTATTAYRLTFDGEALTHADDICRLRFIRATDSLGEIYFDADQAQAMCNLMNGGLFAVVNGALVGLNWDAEGRAELAARPLTADEGVVGEAAPLDGGCLASYINADGARLYYLRAGLDGQNGIYALDADGANRRELLAGEYHSLQLYGGRLYYTDAGDMLASCALDGSDARPEAAIATPTPYVLSDEWLLYTGASDGTLHIRRFADGYDVALSAARSTLPVLMGSHIYYFELPYAASDERAGMAHICRIDMLTREAERAAGFCGAYLAVTAEGMCAAEGQRLTNLDAWWAIENDAYAAPAQVPVFAAGDWLVSLMYEGGAAVRVQVERLSDGAAVAFNS